MSLFPRKPLQSLAAALALAAGLATALVSPAAFGQGGQPVKFVVGFPPGGATDMIARLLAERTRPILNQTVVVENKPGIGGRLGVETVKNNPADGLTWMIAPNATGVFQALLYPTSVLRFDFLADLTPVAMIVSYPLALAVSPKTGATNARAFIDYVKANPAQGLFGTAGLGGHTHFSGLELAKTAGAALTVVPYKGNGPLVTDLLGGQVPAAILTAGDIIQFHRDGKVKVVGVFGPKRSPLMPDVPTLIEQGYNVDTGDAWIGMWANSKTSKADIARMEGAVRQVLAQPDVKEQLTTKAVMTVDFRGAAELDQIQKKEFAYWAPVIKATGFKPEQ